MQRLRHDGSMSRNGSSGLQAVQNADDPRLADYVRLRETSLRRHLESEHGLFIAEGAKVIRRAVEAGYRPRSFLLAERWLPGLADVLERWPHVPVYLVDEALAEKVTGFHVHRGALASLHREVRHTVAALLPAPSGWWCSRTSSTTPTWEPCCAMPQASAGTGRCWRPGRPTRSTVGRSRSAWGRSSACRGLG